MMRDGREDRINAGNTWACLLDRWLQTPPMPLSAVLDENRAEFGTFCALSNGRTAPSGSE